MIKNAQSYSIFMKRLQILSIGLALILGIFSLSKGFCHLEIHDHEAAKERAYQEWKRAQEKKEEEAGRIQKDNQGRILRDENGNARRQV